MARVDLKRGIGHIIRVADNPAFADLVEKRSKAQARVKSLEVKLASARKEFDELNVAVTVLTRHGYLRADDAAEAAPAPAEADTGDRLNDTYMFLLRFIPFSADWAVAPKHVTSEVHQKGRTDLSADYIRTALWRMGQRGILESNGDGRYWRPRKNEAPDAETSEASETTGPVTGRERGYPPSTPEGSIPSGSTPSQPAAEVDWEDDVPF